MSDVSSGNVLFVTDGSGAGLVRSWTDGMLSARVNEIKDTNVQLTTVKDQNISQICCQRCSSIIRDVAGNSLLVLE